MDVELWILPRVLLFLLRKNPAFCNLFVGLLGDGLRMVATFEHELPDACCMQVSHCRVSATGTTGGVTPCVVLKNGQTLKSIRKNEKMKILTWTKEATK